MHSHHPRVRSGMRSSTGTFFQWRLLSANPMESKRYFEIKPRKPQFLQLQVPVWEAGVRHEWSAKPPWFKKPILNELGAGSWSSFPQVWSVSPSSVSGGGSLFVNTNDWPVRLCRAGGRPRPGPNGLIPPGRRHCCRRPWANVMEFLYW
jgi:hypothetical protein